MQTCPHCGKDNPDGEAYCYSCGHILPGGLRGHDVTTKLDDIYESLEPRRRWGTAYFDRRNQIQLSFRDTEETITVDVEDELVLGRYHDDPDSALPDVDLTPYDAIQKGVSRRHLALSREKETVMVIDLGSANNTFLNGQRLIPHEPRILRDNDELRLGRLVIRVAFI